VKLLRDNEEPRETKSSNAREEPKLAALKTESAEPTRAKLLRDMEEPRCKKSSSDTADPTRE